MKHISITCVGGTSIHNGLKAIALVFCITNVYVLAHPTKPNTSASAVAPESARSKILLGRLVVPNHQEILVDGRKAMSGDIVISGSRLQTPNAVDPANVEIGSIAKLDIAPNSDLLLTFDQRSVEVKVTGGSATLSTADGVKGEVIMPDGKVYASVRIASQEKPKPNPRYPPNPNDPRYPTPCQIWKEYLAMVAAAAIIPPLIHRPCKQLVVSPVSPCRPVAL